MPHPNYTSATEYNNNIMTKKLLILASTVVLCCLAACRKEGEKPIGEDGQPSIVGTWNPTDKSYYKVKMYYQDGTFCDSIMAEYDPTSFIFNEDGTVDTPYLITCGYKIEDGKLYLDMMGVSTRVFEIQEFTSSHLVIENVSTGEYYSGNDTLLGYEYEHWDLLKQ